MAWENCQILNKTNLKRFDKKRQQIIVYYSFLQVLPELLKNIAKGESFVNK